LTIDNISIRSIDIVLDYRYRYAVSISFLTIDNISIRSIDIVLDYRYRYAVSISFLTIDIDLDRNQKRADHDNAIFNSHTSTEEHDLITEILSQAIRKEYFTGFKSKPYITPIGAGGPTCKTLDSRGRMISKDVSSGLEAQGQTVSSAAREGVNQNAVSRGVDVFMTEMLLAVSRLTTRFNAEEAARSDALAETITGLIEDADGVKTRFTRQSEVADMHEDR
jgi:hypothetical protein